MELAWGSEYTGALDEARKTVLWWKVKKVWTEKETCTGLRKHIFSFLFIKVMFWLIIIDTPIYQHLQ
jgi:hypothetical protein